MAADVSPRPVLDASVGPDVKVGAPVGVGELITRLTAPNPSFMTGPGTNTYLVGNRQIAVIDPGPIIDTHIDAIEHAATTAGGVIRWILVTHHHRDHAPAAAALVERTGAELIAFGHDEGVTPDRRAGEGFVLVAPDFALRGLHTPGHASDHVCWLLEKGSVLFSGDHVMQGSTVVIRPPDANMADYLTSLDRLLRLDPPIVRIAPGHGRMIGEPAAVVAGIIRHRLEREELVIKALQVHGPGTTEGLLPIVYPDVGEPRLDVARATLWAHLAKLTADGRVRAVGSELGPVGLDEKSLWELVDA
jgi:glyoxylase-like metal-dependent hydrolase (beta-lactamase superfamily II)